MSIFEQLGATGFQGGRRRKPFAAECKVAVYRHKKNPKFKAAIEVIIPGWVGVVPTVWMSHSHNACIISLVARGGYFKRHKIQDDGRVLHNLRSPVRLFDRQSDKLTKIDDVTYVVPLVGRG